MNEDTLIKTLPLPNGRDWEWYADANVIVLAPHLCPAERERALCNLQAQWRREGFRLIPDESVPARTTQPLATLPPQTG